MTIEFRCTQCNKLLRTPEGTSGKKAKCPECGTVVVIPAVSDSVAATVAQGLEPPTPSFSPTPPPPPLQTGAENPYRSPQGIEPPRPAEPRGFHPTKIEFGETLNLAWRAYSAHMGPMVVAMLIFFACYIMGLIVFGILLALLMPLLQDSSLTRLAVVVMYVGLYGIIAYLSIGFLLFTLATVRGERPAYSLLFASGPQMLPFFGVGILLLLGVWVGSILLLIPGLIFGTMCATAPLMLLDQRSGVIDSFRLSWTAMKGNGLTVFLMFFVVGLAGNLVMLLTCGLGLLLAVPFQWMLYVVTYLSITGQRVETRPV